LLRRVDRNYKRNVAIVKDIAHLFRVAGTHECKLDAMVDCIAQKILEPALGKLVDHSFAKFVLELEKKLFFLVVIVSMARNVQYFRFLGFYLLQAFVIDWLLKNLKLFLGVFNNI
jgi:hypothetical protein